MSFVLECKKMKRTGFGLSFFCGGLLAAVVPILNMAVRSEKYMAMDASSVKILLNANWQMMAMLNILLVVTGSCLVYHTEYADGAIQRMCTLSMKESRLFFGKLAVMGAMCVLILVIEASGIAFCSYYWFELSEDIWMELLQNFGYALLLMLPAASGALLIASACKNMWMSLGVGVVCVFTATMLPVKNFAVSLFPFALPFQVFADTAENIVRKYMFASVVELLIIVIAEVLFLNVRRSFQ